MVKSRGLNLRKGLVLLTNLLHITVRTYTYERYIAKCLYTDRKSKTFRIPTNLHESIEVPLQKYQKFQFQTDSLEGPSVHRTIYRRGKGGRGGRHVSEGKRSSTRDMNKLLPAVFRGHCRYNAFPKYTYTVIAQKSLQLQQQVPISVYAFSLALV